MKRIKYVGPNGHANREVGRATGRGDRMIKGEVYEVSKALAKRLLASSAHWAVVKADKGKDDE